MKWDALSDFFTQAALLRLHLPSPFADSQDPSSFISPSDGSLITRDALRESIEVGIQSCIGSNAQVAVAVSGGLHSTVLLLLTADICRTQGRDLLAVTLNMRNDDGSMAADNARRVIESHQVKLKKHLIIPFEPLKWPIPEWTQSGPNLDSFPTLKSAIIQNCISAGAGVILYGTGADRLLAGSRLVRQGSVQNPTREPPISLLLRPRAEWVNRKRISSALWAEIYWQIWLSCLNQSSAPHYLTNEARMRCDESAAALKARILRSHLDKLRTFETASLVDKARLAKSLSTVADDLIATPFLHPKVLFTAIALPLRFRKAIEQSSPFLRNRALILSLIPNLPLPSAMLKPYSTRKAFELYWKTMPISPRVLVEISLLRDDWHELPHDTWDLRMIHALETWMAGSNRSGLNLVS